MLIELKLADSSRIWRVRSETSVVAPPMTPAIAIGPESSVMSNMSSERERSVPSSVCVDGHVTAKGGDLIVAGETSNGIDPEVDQGEPRTDAPQLDLDAEVQFGEVIVTQKAPEEVDDHGPDWEDRGDETDYRGELDSQRQVCGR